LIEHASFAGPDAIYRFDSTVARQLAEAGIPVTPTLQVFRDMADILPDGPERARWLQMRDNQRDGARRLHELGVPLLAGSDAGWRATTFDTFWKELDELVICGLSHVAAIHAATGAISRALGYDKQFGMIQPGLVADLVVVDGDVAKDIRRLAKVKAVYQDGVQILATPRG
jgi:imidazolonepropionase-like amidohydrolase